jgi:TonB-linked SusC/RagA family outer membrane protein
LKDGQAAIYGARGAAGVIIVTTKRGKGKPTITYDSYTGIQVPRTGNVWNKLDPQGMADLAFLAAKNSGQVDAQGNVSSGQYGTGKIAILPDYIKAGSYSGVGPNSDAAAKAATNLALYNNDYSKGPIHLIVPANKKGTDWWDEIFDPAPMTSHSITASGGQDKSSYLFSLNYFDQKGTLLNTYLKRYSMRANTSWNIKDNIRIGENLQLFYKDNPRIGNNERGNAVNNTAWEQPIIPVYDAGGGFGGTAGSNLGNSSNPVANQVRAKDNVNHNWQIQGNVFAEVDFAKNFTARTVFGGNLDNYYGFYHNYRNYENAENPASNGYGEYSGYNNNWNFTNTLSYANVFKQDHSIKLMAGYEALKVQGRQVGGSRVNYFSDDINFLSLNTGSPIGQNNYSNLYKSTTNSILAKVDYAFRDKYLVGLNGRRDGSSVFGPNTKFGNFWSASAAWVISNEDFFKNVKFVNTLKLRGSYGLQGSIANVGQLNQYFYATNLGNLSTGWEKSKTLDFGFEATVLNNKLDISFDWYKKTIEGLLFQDQAPAVVGVGSSLPQVNIGDMQNTGIDLSLNYRGKVNNDLSYTVGANLGAYKNEIINIPGSAGFFETAYTHSSGPQIRNAIGQPVSAFFGYKIAGIFQSAADVASYAKMVDAAPGRFKYEDINKDGKISDDDRTFFGNPNPDFTLGINLNVAYKRFDISTNLYGSFGNEILNETRYFQDFLPSFQNSKSIPLLTESWLPTRPSTVWPIVENNTYFSTNGVINNFYVEDGTYMRVKQLSLGYTIDPATLKRYGIDKARVFVQGANLFTITNYSGLDPEVAGSTSSFGVDKGNYPPMKTFNVGISLTF